MQKYTQQVFILTGVGPYKQIWKLSISFKIYTSILKEYVYVLKEYMHNMYLLKEYMYIVYMYMYTFL